MGHFTFSGLIPQVDVSNYGETAQCFDDSGASTLHGNDLQRLQKLQAQGIIKKYECLNKLTHEQALKILNVGDAVSQVLGNTNAYEMSKEQSLAAGHAFITALAENFGFTPTGAANRAVLLNSGTHAKDPCYDTTALKPGILAAAATYGINPENVKWPN